GANGLSGRMVQDDASAGQLGFPAIPQCVRILTFCAASEHILRVFLDGRQAGSLNSFCAKIKH
ncbi:hypothetical protein ACP3WA_26440, partial [Salmonella enterica]|uniref:hypothetical protein n=1 Tax=Salmonella enterica TaxID=28901 RepID=UPI003CE9A07B